MAQTALIRTMSHELTHDMRLNAPEKYGRLRDAIVDLLERQGAKLREMGVRLLQRTGRTQK